MRSNVCARKALVWTLCLLLAAGPLALPVLADEEPAAPAAETSATAASKAETPASESSETASAKTETPASESSETPAAKTETSTSETSEATAAKTETSAAKDEPSTKEETSAVKEETSALAKEETTEPAEAEADAPAGETAEPTAAETDAPAEEPAAEPEEAEPEELISTVAPAASRSSARSSRIQLQIEPEPETAAQAETADQPVSLSVSSSGALTAADAAAEPETADEPETAAEPETRETAADGQAPDPSAAYTGITIDGDFADWDAVPRYAIADTYDIWGNEKGYDTVDQVSVVWDGEYVYILLVAQGDPDGSGNWNSVCGAGPNNNGQFAIVTDLNYQLLVQPAVVNGQPTVSGVDDALVAVNNTEWFGAPHMWEIAIPASQLPTYLETIDFGLYLVDPVITGIADLQGGDGEDKSFNGVVVDGSFGDWTYYPMTTIEYATPGTQDTVRDAHGALWADDATLYGYVASNMTAHLGAQGGDFLADISLAFNGDRDYKEYPTDGNFYPRIVSFDSGEAVVLNEGTTLEPGDYTFYIFDTRTDPTAGVYDAETNATSYPTVADLKKQAFGVIKIHVDGVLDQAEFELDLEKVAAYIGKDADTAFQTVEIQWGRLGQQWITYAGTSTAPVISVCLLVGAVGAPVCYSELKRRRSAKKSGADGEEK